MTHITLDQALARGHGEWRSFTCPSHDDTNPSARVNIRTGKWVCMSCHAKGDVKGYVPDPIMELDYAMDLLDAHDLVKTESWLDQFDSGPVADYWISRFSEDVCRLYRLGWDGTRGDPCYPIRDMAGRPLGIVHRNIGDPGGPKYKYPRGVKKTELLFGVKELTQSDYLVLVEGAMDVCAVRETGMDAVGSYGSAGRQAGQPDHRPAATGGLDRLRHGPCRSCGRIEGGVGAGDGRDPDPQAVLERPVQRPR
jgi:hypothetical protein